jgi:hypothetical protein
MAKGKKPKASTTTAQQNAFLEAFSQLGTVKAAALLINIDRGLHYKWLKDEAYAQRFKDADEDVTQTLEQEMMRRAVRGTDRPVFHKGKQCGTIREYSDVLLIFALKARRPDKYREHHQHDVNHSGSVKMYGWEAPVDAV